MNTTMSFQKKDLKNLSHQYRYFNFLSMLFITIMLGTYVLAYKMVAIGKFIESGGIFIFPINYAIIDIISEVYGYHQAKKLIKQAFICCLFFATIVPLIALLPAPENWPHQSGYDYIFKNVFRFFFANTIGIIIGITINGNLISKWKIILKGKYFWLRSIGSSAIGELITSIIADILAFMGTAKFLGVLKLMLAIYSIKLLYAILLALPNSLIVIHLKLKEKIDLLDDNTTFNPFNINQNKKREQHVYISSVN
ncbi:MAG: VUT family protein [Gammaproteobacteria bacterium]|nr:MAG: VUT family protein [Gammaproteobacteria bacterium]